MTGTRTWRQSARATLAALCTMAVLGGCASLGSSVEPPRVSLRNVQVTELDLSRQSFLLDFDITNPNPFPLPVRRVAYGIELDGYRFASGEAQSAFTVPAHGEGVFAIDVDVDLLNTAPALMFIVRDGMYRDIPYRLSGRIDVGAPFAVPVRFENAGHIRLDAGRY